MAISVATVSNLSFPEEPMASDAVRSSNPRSGPSLVVVAPDDQGEHDAAVTGLLAQRVGLTSRDVMVLQFLSEGWTTAAIARELAYAESTIKKEVHLIVHRLGARNRTHAVAMAVRGCVI
jgi:DNA-binding NarL/FixJ family response regulator